MTLFDVSDYGGQETPKEARKRERLRSSLDERSPLPPIEQLSGGWRLIRNRYGVLAFAHLVKCSTTESGVLTLCDQWGTTLPRFDDDMGRRCPLCDMEAQL